MTDTTIRRIVGNRVHTPCFVITFIVLVLWTFYCANHAYPQTAPCGVTIQQICACNGKVYDPHLKPVPGCVKPPAAPEPEKVCRVTTQFQDTAVVGDWLPCSAAYLAVMNSRGDVKAWISDGPKSVPVPLAAPEPQAKPLENIAPPFILQAKDCPQGEMKTIDGSCYSPTSPSTLFIGTATPPLTSSTSDWTKTAHWHKLSWRDWSCYKVSEFTDGKGRQMFSCKLNRKITGKEK